jgi:hypothetical protein
MMLAVEGNICKIMDRGPQFTRGVFPSRNNMLGKQIIVGN